MKCDYACGTAEHGTSRRQFLGGLATGVGALTLGGSASWIPVGAAEQLKKTQKRIVTFFLHGGVSQLESWDPKPNTVYGGPFRSIATSVPDVRISELLPFTAQQMHHLAIVRGINTKNSGHGPGQIQMTTGHNPMGTELPHLGAVAAKALTPPSFSLPGHILIKGGGNGGSAAYLGPRFAAVTLEDGKAPQYSQLPATVSGEAESRRQEFRRSADDRFAGRRRTADTDAYTLSYDQARDLMARRDVFDAPPALLEELQALRAAGRIEIAIGVASSIVEEQGRLTALELTTPEGTQQSLPLDLLLVRLGLVPRLGPITEWGLALERKQLVVDTATFATSVPGIHAVGDAITYPGKRKLILSGFHEATLAAFGAAEWLAGHKLPLEYTTSSALLQQRLGVQQTV